MERRAPAQSSSRDQCTQGPQPQEQHEHCFCSSSTNAFISYSLYTVRRYCTSPGAPRPPDEVGLTPRQYTEWNVAGARTLYWRSLSVGAAA